MLRIQAFNIAQDMVSRTLITMRFGNTKNMLGYVLVMTSLIIKYMVRSPIEEISYKLKHIPGDFL